MIFFWKCIQNIKILFFCKEIQFFYSIGQLNSRINYHITFVIIYYERYVVINPGVKLADGVKELDFLTEEEYLDILDTLPKENHLLDDDDTNKFIAKMGAEA